MKVKRIELYHVEVPLKNHFYPSWIPGYPQTVNRFTLLKLTTDDGIEGIAAGTAFEKERQGLGGLIGPYLMGIDPTDIQAGRQRLREISYLGWRNYWMEAAFWDIKGKAEGKPLWELLGGKEGGRVEVYASVGEVRSPEQRVEDVLRLREKGFKTVKLRVHSFDVAEDLAQLEAVRKELGDSIDLAVDANQGWPVSIIDDTPIWDLKRAAYFAEACAELGIRWIEEPLDMYALDDLVELGKRSKVPIAGAELSSGWQETKFMLEKGCFDIYQPDATMGGGISDAKKVLDACCKKGLGFTPHTWSNGLGFLVNLHVHASGPRNYPLEFPYDPPGWVPECRDGILAKPILAGADSAVAVPCVPGLGIDIDSKKLKKYGKRFFKMTPLSLAVKTVREKGLVTAVQLARKKKLRSS